MFRYACLNPHAEFQIEAPQGKAHYKPIVETWSKWLPTHPTSPHWYTVDDLCGLVAAYLRHCQNGRSLTVRDFVALFLGLSSTAKRKAVLEGLGLSRAPLSALMSGDDIDRELVGRLLAAMQRESKDINPTSMGVIGEQQFRTRFARRKCEEDTFRYKRFAGNENGMPYIIEAAFAYVPGSNRRALASGVNWSPSIYSTPFQTLDDDWTLDALLEDQECGEDEPILLALHLVTPKPLWKDRGKSNLSLEGEVGENVIKAVQHVTKPWRRQRRAEERNASARMNRERTLARRKAPKTSLKDAIGAVLSDGIDAASAFGRYIFPQRNLFYSVRQLIQKFTSRTLKQSYFDKVVLAWEKVNGLIRNKYRDPRGHLVEPHTNTLIPLGTREVEAYTIPNWLYHTILYVEKKGFGPIFQESQLAELYDLAIISAEGYATDAAKLLMSRAEQGMNITILCLHDADPYGKNIWRALTDDTFRAPGINVVDIGLDLEQALAMGLPTEEFIRKRALPQDLELTDLEREYFEGTFDGYDEDGHATYRCQRVELNALAADPDRFIAYVEGKLQEHGCARKLVPPAEVTTAHAAEAHNQLLRNVTAQAIASKLGIQERIERISDIILPTLNFNHVPGQLETWATDPKPEPWTVDVQRQVEAMVEERADDIDSLVDEALADLNW